MDERVGVKLKRSDEEPLCFEERDVEGRSQGRWTNGHPGNGEEVNLAGIVSTDDVYVIFAADHPAAAKPPPTCG